jgi:hypothetical protein
MTTLNKDDFDNKSFELVMLVQAFEINDLRIGHSCKFGFGSISSPYICA